MVATKQSVASTSSSPLPMLPDLWVPSHPSNNDGHPSLSRTGQHVEDGALDPVEECSIFATMIGGICIYEFEIVYRSPPCTL